jgi:signal transduction histidine kinase
METRLSIKDIIIDNKKLANVLINACAKEPVIIYKVKEKQSSELIDIYINLAETLFTIQQELTTQIEENEKRVAELIIANKELALQNEENGKNASELIIIKDELKHSLQLNADKDLFISILAHDLRSPFTAILGLTGILKEDVKKLDIDRIEEIADEINNSAQKSFELLEDILLWSSVQFRRIPFNPQCISIKEIVNTILELIQQSASAKNITINYFEKDRFNAFADCYMLKAILRNLVTNAIKFTKSGGSININAEKNSENVLISVSDNGIGISPEYLTKLFDISEVISTKGTANEIGTGLGLLLCKEFVEKHGGKIWVESVVGKGSEFKFTLPIHNEHVNVCSEKS